MVKYIGPLPDRSDIYFGLELDSEGFFFVYFMLFYFKFFLKQIFL